MKLKDLIDRYSFDEIIPEIEAIWENGRIHQFREAFDILRSMNPAEDDGLPINVHLVKGSHDPYYRVSNISGSSWERTLGREIEVDSDCNLTEKEVLAHCLWERTYYGFSPEQEEETMSEYDQNEIPKERHEIIEEISELYPEISSDNLTFMLGDREYFQGCFCAPVENGVDYLIESITKYAEFEKADPKSPIVLLLRVPEGYEVSPKDKQRLTETISSVCGERQTFVGSREIKDLNKLKLSLFYNN